ncbi:MAG: AAA family ATPase [Rhodocyclaceae bacterium]|nr:AAA family ATPase [Rhodocyclaceae bacterium]
MYLDHFGLREPPFRITPHTEFFFAGANRGATLDALIYAITHDEGIVKVSGEVGSGKTMLCRVLLERLPANVVTIYLATPSLSRDDILYALAAELHLPVPPSTRSAQIVRLLQEHLIALYAKGHQVVVLIDEAHVMPRETLEEIRLLSNLETNHHKLLQLVMFGQPELNDVLARHDMRQLKERITHNFTLGPLGREETADYIDFRLRAAGYKGASIFSPTAIGQLTGAAQGLTRRINILADKSLLAAYAAGRHDVGPEETKAAIEDCDFSVAAAPPSGRKAMLALAGGACLALLLALFLWLQGKPATTSIDSITATPAAAAALPVPAATAANPPPTPSATPPEPRTATLTEQRLAAGQAWLEHADDEHWFIQLRAMDAAQGEQIESFLQRLESQLPADQTRAYLGKRGNTPRLGIIFGEYESHAQASRAMAALPTEIQNSQPYLRQVKKLR